jgi:predicted RecA/RadA family phage recombinase
VAVFIISDPADDDFENIASGASVHNTFDIATNYDLSAGGVFDIASEGVFYTVNLNSTVHTYGQVLRYSSNPISATIDGDAAKRAHDSYRKQILLSSA